MTAPRRAVLSRVRRALATTTLVAFGLVPLWGVFYRGWSVVSLVLLCWIDLPIGGAVFLLEEVLLRRKPRWPDWREVGLGAALVLVAGVVYAAAGLIVYFSLTYRYAAELRPFGGTALDWTLVRIGLLGLTASHAATFLIELLAPPDRERLSRERRSFLASHGLNAFCLFLASWFAALHPLLGFTTVVLARMFLDVRSIWLERAGVGPPAEARRIGVSSQA
jgi:hypothetical protein